MSGRSVVQISLLFVALVGFFVACDGLGFLFGALLDYLFR